MSELCSDFLGIYTVSQGTITESPEDPRQPVTAGNKVVISCPDPAEPCRLQMVVIDRTVHPPEESLTVPLTYRPELGVMFCQIEDYKKKGQPLSIQVSLYQDIESNFKTIYGVMIFGDPENVGVWGADEGEPGPLPRGSAPSQP